MSALELPAVKPWRVPVQARQFIFELGLYAVAGACCFAAGFLLAPDRVTQTRTVKVEKSWGRPDATVAPTQLDMARVEAAGIGVCDIFEAKRTVVCHP